MTAIIDAVSYGHDNAVTREELSRRTGLSDRALRDGINKSEELIINLQDGKGYFRPLPELRHCQYMDICLVLLPMCDAIYMLKGWQGSEGALEEYREARHLGLEVLFEE